MITFELPLPPSANRRLDVKRVGKKTIFYKNKKVTDYEKQVSLICHKYRHAFMADQKLSMHVNVFPANRRRRDLDNFFKILQDSLQKAEVIPDDYQFDELIIRRESLLANKLVVKIKVYEPLEN